MKKWGWLSLVFLLNGCNEPTPIDVVKNTVGNRFDPYTYGKLLDERQVCRRVLWDDYLENGVKTIRYRCQLKKGKEIFNYYEEEEWVIREQAIGDYLAATGRRARTAITGYINNINQVKHYLDNRDRLSPVERMLLLDWRVGNITFQDSVNVYGQTEDGLRLLRQINTLMGTADDLPTAYRNGIMSPNDKTASLIDQVTQHASLHYQQQILRALRATQDRNNEKDRINQEAIVDSQQAINRYRQDHTDTGEEVLIWQQQPDGTTFALTRQYRTLTWGDGHRTQTPLCLTLLAYATTHDVNDIDQYWRLQYRGVRTGENTIAACFTSE